MTLRVEPHAEPIPGYRFIERLGAGGFGEVWKAEAPGGLLKAIKVVFGDLRATDPDGNHDLARQELKALKRVQAVRHPYLLGIDRYDVIDGRLLIVTELADGNLWDRFRQSREAGLQGIPRDDLIRYMLEAAEVLDLMHDRHQLQHLDIKPPNLFLVHDHVKVGDFGLVKDLEGVQGMISGGVTPHYAAPETFDGHLSRHCDQYSLAIVYAELLTGQRPYAGGTVQQIILQHLQGKPNLTAVPPSDRPILNRALAKDPAKRFPNCSEFIGMLFDMSGGGFRLPASLLASLSGRYGKGESAATLTPPPTVAAVPDTQSNPTTPRSHPPATRYRTGDGCLQPALVLGIGGVGLAVLQRLRQRLNDDAPGELPHLRLLYLDTDADALQAAYDGRDGPALASDEVLPIRLQRAGHYLKPRPDGHKITDGWFDSQLLGRLPRQPATLGQRALGRLAFADHAVAIADKVRDELAAVVRPDALDAAVRRTGLGLRTTQPRVLIVSGLGGATGGGIAIDIAYLARRALAATNDQAPDVAGIFVLPPTGGATPADIRAAGNAFAMLTELLHFSRPDTTYVPAVAGLDAAPEVAAPFASLLVVPAAGEVLAADALLRELVTPLGRAFASGRGSPPAEPVARSYGVARFTCPAAAVTDRATRRLAAATLERWLAPETPKLRGAVNAWVGEQWAAQDLGPEAATRRLNQAVEAALGQPADAAFVVGPDEAPSEALARFEGWVGRGAYRDDPGMPGRLDSALAEAAATLTAEWGGKLASLAVCLLEQPGFRFAGAERAVALLRDGIGRAQSHFAPLGDEWLRKAARASARVHALLSGEQPRRAAPNELHDALVLLPRWRLHGLMLKAVSAVYAALGGSLDAATVEAAQYRRRVEAARTLLAARAGDAEADAPGLLLPDDCATVDDAAAKLIAGLPREARRAYDDDVRATIDGRFGGLAACLTAPDAAAQVVHLLTERAAVLVAGRAGAAGAVEAFQERFADSAAAGRELAAAFEAAEPAYGTYGTPELAALAVPPGPTAEAFRELANRSLVPLELTAATSPADVALVRERPAVPLTALPAMGLEALEAYRLLSRADGLPPHARSDVADWTA